MPPGILGLSTPTILAVQILAAAVFVVLCALSSAGSDRLGRRNVLLFGNLVAIPIGIAVFPIMDSGGVTAFAIAMALLMGVVGICYGPAAAYLPEIFDARYRYTGAGLGDNLGTVVGGAVPIVLAAEILQAWGSDALGIYLAGLAVLSTACLLALPERRNSPVADMLAAPQSQESCILAGPVRGTSS